MRSSAFFLFALLLGGASATAQTVVTGDSIRIGRATSPIKIDGDLSDEAWQQATRVVKWYETQPGDNTEPRVRNVGYLTYDSKFLYAAFEFDDPDAAHLRAPYAEHDNITGSGTDYGGILIDGRGSASTGAFFVATPRNVQYDSIEDDVSGENASPDFFWDSATRVTATGWTLEMRIPFSTIRYRHVDPQTWRVMLYRNYPHGFHYQFFSAMIPRNANCFVCHANVLTGLEDLPKGGHMVIAPYTTATDVATNGGTTGAPLGSSATQGHIGVDAKFLPNADNALDLTVHPDFSQVESDTAQISTNQRFALFYAERRPFFLEGVDLFATPIQAVYTRTITAPRVGVRATGKEHGIRYTVLVADDAGGGSAILPGSNGSSFASIDFGATVFIARAKHDLGLSFVSVLATDRENHDGQGNNRVVGPDFQFRPGPSDSVTGQWLFSSTVTPNHPELTSEWNGQTLTGHAAQFQWSHSTTHVDGQAQYRDATGGFRADTGFVPQVGFRDVNANAGWSVHPEHFPISKIRSWLTLDRQSNLSGGIIGTNVEPGIGLDTKYSGFVNVSLPQSQARTAGGSIFTTHQFSYYAQFSPSRVLTLVEADGRVGDSIDFDNSRLGRGATLNLAANLRPSNHLEVALVENAQWLNVTDTAGAVGVAGGSDRLFTSRVSRLKTTYNFTSRLYARAIAQYVATSRNPLLYTASVDARSGDFSGSLLVVYKLNWQSVMYIGYGDDRELTQPSLPGAPPLQAGHQLAPLDRQLFVKISYAFQR